MDVEQGFRIGERLFRWGVLAGEVAEALEAPGDEGDDARWRRIEVACGPTWGFDTISVEMTASGSDRPVTALCYRLAALPGDPLPDPGVWLDPLCRVLGKPQSAASHDLPGYGDPADGVRYFANWPRGDQSVGLSLYGGARKVSHGLAAGCIWLNWATIPAAAPFLAEWRARADELDAMAASHSGIVTFMLGSPLPSGGRRETPLERDSSYALNQPHLLPTPKSIADHLGAKGIGFWRSADHARWSASTKHVSIVLPMGEPLTVDWHDVLPAKGGGFSEISIEGWSARDIAGSQAIRSAIAALETIPGVTINRVDGYDC